MLFHQRIGRVKFIIASLLICSCQSVRVTAPVPSVDSPEIREVNPYRIELGVKSGGSVEITNNAGARPPVIGDGSVSSDIYIFGDLGFFLNPKFMIKGGLFGPAVWPTGLFGKGQWQVLGKDQGESKVGDTSLSLIGEAMAQNIPYQGDQEYFGGPGHRNWRATGRMTAASVAVSYGYRTSGTDLLFFGAGYGRFRTSGSISQDATDNYPSGTYEVAEKLGSTASLALGLDTQSGSSNLLLKLIYYKITQDALVLDRLGLEFSVSYGGALKARVEPPKE